MSEGTLRAGSGGVLIKQIIRLTGVGPDYTSEAGDRFLERGMLETDTTKFDTTIWDTPAPINTTLVDTAPALRRDNGGNKSDSARLSTGRIVITHCSRNTSKGIYSDDEGLSWQQTGNIPSVAKLNHLAVMLEQNDNLISIVNDLTGSVYYSSNSWASYGIKRTGLGVAIETFFGNDNAIIAATYSSTTAYRTTNGGASWSPITLPVRIRYAGRAIGSLFVAGHAYQTHVNVSNDSGLTWANYPDTFPLGVEALWCSDTTFYVLSNSYVFTSTDGVNWANAGQAVFENTNTASKLATPSYNVKFYGGIFFDGIDRASVDGVRWYKLVHSFPKARIGKTLTAGESVFETAAGGALFAGEAFIEKVNAMLYAGGYPTDYYSNDTMHHTEYVKISEE
jgi:hypothetical protein